MAIRAPWKGWLRIAMPTVSFLILSLTLAITFIAILNVASLHRSPQHNGDTTARDAQQSSAHVTSQLVFFWATIPVVLLVVTTCETFCLWTDRLRPIWVLVSSTIAFTLWLTQLVLWALCLQSGPSAFCPSFYLDRGTGDYPGWNNASPTVAVYLVPFLFVCYIAQTIFSAKALLHQRKSSFRKSDLRGSWALKQEIAASYSNLASESETRLMLAARHPSESHYSMSLSEGGRLLAPRESESDMSNYSPPSTWGRTRTCSQMSELSRGKSSPAMSEYGDSQTFTAFSGTWRASKDGRTRTNTMASSVGIPFLIDTTTYDN